MKLQPKRFVGACYRADDATMFQYEVTVEPTVGGSVWAAVVRADGELRGRPNGTLTHPRFLDDALEGAVRELVETSIRDRIGVG